MHNSYHTIHRIPYAIHTHQPHSLLSASHTDLDSACLADPPGTDASAPYTYWHTARPHPAAVGSSPGTWGTPPSPAASARRRGHRSR